MLFFMLFTYFFTFLHSLKCLGVFIRLFQKTSEKFFVIVPYYSSPSQMSWDKLEPLGPPQAPLVRWWVPVPLQVGPPGGTCSPSGASAQGEDTL